MDAAFVGEARDAARMVAPTVAEIAFAGRSNVGKSTLLNMVCQRRSLARTSRTPGATRGIIWFDVRFRSGTSIRLVDLPGYGFAVRAKSERRAWGPLIERYLIERTALRGVVILVDARRGPEDEEAQLIDFLRTSGRAFVVAVTKIDKLNTSERGALLERFHRRDGVRALGVSGVTAEGREALLRAMFAMLPAQKDAPAG